MNGKRIYTQQYFAETGLAVYTKRREACKPKFKIHKVKPFIDYAVQKIKEDKWSPDVVVGYAQVNGLFEKHERVCTKTLYHYIDKRLIDVTNMDLLLKLRLNTKKRRLREHKRCLGPSIEQRPLEVNERQTIVH